MKKTLKRAAAIAASLTMIAAAPICIHSSDKVLTADAAYVDNYDYTTGSTGTLEYAKYSDHIEISGCQKGMTSLDIPETIDGLPVTGIKRYAFQCSSLQTVTLPESIKTIGYYAFSMSSDLTEVYLPDSIEVIEMHAFDQCPKLEKVEFPDHLIEMHSKVFDETPWLTAQRAKDPLVIVNGALIDARTAEGDIEIPLSVKYVSPSAFASNDKVTSVVFPAGVTTLCDNTFFMCSNLKSVDVRGATLLDSMAFSYCSNLTDLKLSKKLKSIDGYTFSDITSSATITFYGTQADWESVDKPENDKFLQNAKMVFVDYSEPETESTSENDVLRGDANCDGMIDMSDVVIVMQASLNPKKYGVNGTSPDRITAEGEKAGDVDGKEGLSANDALIIQRYSLKLIDTL